MRALLVSSAGVMLFLAVACLAFPRTMQGIAIRAVAIGPAPECVRSFVQSKAYLWNVRAVGVAALLVAVLLAYAVIRSV
jgi:hypothetical protein